MPVYRFLKRKWLLRQPFPGPWQDLLDTRVPVYHRLPAGLKEKLRQRIPIFMDEKRFEGCGGLQITPEIKLVIAACACVLILEEPSDYYGDLQAILVYPDDYIAPVHEESDSGVISVGYESRKGEYWGRGSIVLSWKDIEENLYSGPPGRNLIYHEFSHQLDDRYGLTAGISETGQALRDDEWSRVLANAYRRLIRDVETGKRGLFDPYGTEHPAEFFSVATEAFFERPDEVYRTFPKVYRLFRSFYGVDPVSWRGG